MRGERGVTLVEVLMVLTILTAGMAMAAPALGNALSSFRAQGATVDLYSALHLTQARARATGLTHALVLEPGGRAFHIVEDPAGARRTVVGPMALVDGVVATSNVTIRFSAKGFAVPTGTITVRDGAQTRRLIVNILGRVRVVSG